jgi:hypothetical protein
MAKKKSANLADEDKGVRVHRTGRYQKAQELKAQRKKTRKEDFSQAAARIVKEATEER